jgi:transposase-like protein
MLPRQYSEQEKLNVVRRIVVDKPDMKDLSKELDLPQGKLFAWKNQYQSVVHSQIRRKQITLAPDVPLSTVEAAAPVEAKSRKKNKYLSEGEKLEALQLLADGNTAEEVALAYDISPASLTVWKAKFGAKEPTPELAPPTIVYHEEDELEEEIIQPVVKGQPYYSKKVDPIAIRPVTFPYSQSKPVIPKHIEIKPQLPSQQQPDLMAKLENKQINLMQAKVADYEKQLGLMQDKVADYDSKVSMIAKLEKQIGMMQAKATNSDSMVAKLEASVQELSAADSSAELQELRDIIASQTLEIYRLKAKR